MNIFDIAVPCNMNYVALHLYYNDPSSEPLIYEVIAQLNTWHPQEPGHRKELSHHCEPAMAI